MKKILIICGVIVASIVLMDIFLQKYVDSTFESMSAKLDEICKNIDNKQACTNKIEELDGLWESNFKKMACYLEHDELEKVKTQIVIIKSGMEIDDKEFVFEEVNRAKYIINHIKEKECLKIDNIF